MSHEARDAAAGDYVLGRFLPPEGAPLTLQPAPADVVAFERRRGADVVRVAVNLSAQPQAFEGQVLPAWGWRIG